MTTRSTSARAFHEIEDNGLLTAARFKVYAKLFDIGPATGSQLNDALKTPSAHKRLSELYDVGVVKEVGEGTCPITGMTAILWDVTEVVPPPRQKVRQWRKVAQFDTFLQLIRSDFPEQAKNRALDYSIETERSGTARVWVVYSKDYA